VIYISMDRPDQKKTDEKRFLLKLDEKEFAWSAALIGTDCVLGLGLIY